MPPQMFSSVVNVFRLCECISSRAIGLAFGGEGGEQLDCFTLPIYP